jgi:ABC-type Fe3+ transport system substrate-binding protein
MAPWLCRAPAIGAAAFAMALVACTAGAQSLDQDKVKALHAAAKKEGQVIIWGTQRREVEWIPAAFGKLFSGIDVQFLGDNDIAVKAIAEARAGRHQVDVYQNSLTGTLPLVQRDLLANIDWSLFGIDSRNIAFDGKMAYTSNIVYTVAYNNKLAKDADAPKDWIGILDERYKGKGASSTFLLPRLIGALGLAWGDDKALQFARDIVAKTNLLLTRAPRESLLQ